MKRLLVLAAFACPAPVLRADEADDLLAKRLAAVVRDPRLSIWSRVEAAKSIGKLGPRASAAVPDLIAELERARGREVEPLQEAVVNALGQIGAPARAALPTLARASGRTVDVDQSIKRATDSILAASDTQDVDALTRQLQSRDSSLRVRAAKALGNLGPAARTAVPALVTALDDPDPDVRRAILTALRLIQPDARPTEPVVRAVVADLKDPDPLIRLVALRTLARFGPAAGPAAPAVQGLLSDPDPEVRRAAADALTRITLP